MKKNATHDTFQGRVAIVTVCFLLFFTLIAARLFKLQIIDGRNSLAQAQEQHSIFVRLMPARGEIKITDKFSQDGYSVATNIKHYLAYAVPQDIKNPGPVADSLAAALLMDAQEILPKLTGDKKYVPIKKNLTEAEQQKIADLNLPGIFLDSEDGRLYPERDLLSQVLGFVGYSDEGSTKVGLYGLERFFQDDLVGKPGYVNEEKDTAGAWIFGGKRDVVPAEDGDDLILTIDKSIQFQAESVLRRSVTDHGADGGSVIVMNPKTGAIVAMAGYPGYDPNEYNKVMDPKVYTNEATTGNYEPGSTFKAITMAAAINEGKITPDTTYNDTGSVVIDGYTIRNSDGKVRGIQTMTQVLDESLNTGVIFAKDQIGNPTFYQYLKKFGFGEKTGIQLPETKGSLDSLKYNIAVNYGTATFGQGISVTPIQMIQAYSVLANRGTMVRPYLVQTKISSSGKVTETKLSEVSKIITSKTADTVTAMLVDVVENGHGKRAAVPGYYLAGKTGTAQVAGKNGGYDPDNNIGSFIGYGPVEDPKFLMMVRINHPRDVQYAESTAAPAWGEIAKFILNYYNVAPTRDIH